MKKLYFFILCVSIGATSFAQPPNGGFENWTTVPLGENLDYWQNGNQETDSNIVYKSTDKVSGMYSLRMRTVYEANGDTAFGYIVNGDPDNGTGGLPCTSAPDSIVGYYKYDVKGSDTALVLAIPKVAGNPTSQALLKITGTQTTWKRFSIPFVYPAFKVCDSIIVGATSSNALAQVGMEKGSWLMLDSLHFKGTNPCKIPNHSFEDWTPVSYEDPNSWGSFNRVFAGYGLGDTLCQKTTDANSGTYAVRLNTIGWGPNPDTIMSQLHLGGVNWNNWQPYGVPYTQQPAYLNGYYKFSPSGTDTAIVGVIAKKSGTAISSDWSAFTGNVGSYTGFSIALNIPSAPDTVGVIVAAGNNPGSSIWVDDLSFSAWPVFVDEKENAQTSIYPNPSTGTFIVNGINGHKVSVYSLTGALVHQELLQGRREVMLPSDVEGLFIVKVTDEEGTLLHTQKLNVIR